MLPKSVPHNIIIVANHPHIHINADVLMQNLTKLKEKTSCTTRNLLQPAATQPSKRPITGERVRSTSRIFKKDPLHEKMLKSELLIFRKEAEFRFSCSKVNLTYKFPRFINDLGENNKNNTELQKNQYAVIPSNTSGVEPESVDEKPNQVKALKSMKSIYLQQRNTNNDQYIYGSLRKMVEQKMNAISGRVSPITKIETSRNTERALPTNPLMANTMVRTKRSNDSIDSKYSIDVKIRKAPHIKNMMLQKVMTTLPNNTWKADRTEDSNTQGLSVTKTGLITSTSVMKSFSNEKIRTINTYREAENPLLITKCKEIISKAKRASVNRQRHLKK